ncbi:aldose epimerase family protein [Paracoccus sp. MBLB3053]|uniref:Aldose 1-epimerase n=1 Tax=Paracoccus aurantius TaxID=3073814 RepID=A0ABU2HNV6_9RHOB|nr:aldose epimerase family protein [Paracoccus sp. MBLB3053]MDS9466724.1 aldose epimerase family protein [Paracoccus sp. MBLB3053]
MRENFGTLPDGQLVERLTISGHGLMASVITLGASLQDLRLAGIGHPLVLGYPTLSPYLSEGRFFGAIVGRCANRISSGVAEIEGRTYVLDRNERDRTTLHGGADGTGRRNWKVVEQGTDFVILADELPDGHMGFPGRLEVRVIYRILPELSLQITIEAKSDATTLCNFAQHSYFNLDGQKDLSDHILCVPANTYLPVDGDLIPLGSPAPVEGSHLDFREPVRLGNRLGGELVDHNLCVSLARTDTPKPVATLTAGELSMRILSTEPGLQVYTADHLQPGSQGIGGFPYGKHAGVALESQVWPDAIHHPDYPSAILPAGQSYRQITILSFAVPRES